MAKRKSRVFKKVRADGRCHDYRTKAPLGCCEFCWHEFGQERPGRSVVGGVRVLDLCGLHRAHLEAQGIVLQPVP